MRPATHSPDGILDAARELVLDGGPRAAGAKPIAAASGAPVGSIYYRFGSRDGVLAALWVRTVLRFQAAWKAPLAIADGLDDPVETGAAMAAAAVAFARTDPEDVRLLLAVRPRDLLDAHSDELAEGLAEANADAREALLDLTRAVTGRVSRASVESVALAVVDLPHGALRRHDGRPPKGLEEEIGNAARLLLRTASA